MAVTAGTLACPFDLFLAGAYRVYVDPADLPSRADELGVRGLPLGT